MSPPVAKPTQPNTTAITPVEPAKQPPKDVSVQVENSEEVRKRPFILEGRLGVGAAQHGDRNGTLLAIDSVSNLGDFTNYEWAASLLFNLNHGKLKFRVGPEIRGQVTTGDENTGGSTLYTFGVGPKVEADWKAIWGNHFFAGPSRVGLDFSVGYGTGTTTAGTFSLHDQGGLDLSAGLTANLMNVSMGGVEIGLDAFVRTSATYGGEFNTPFNTVGAQLVFRSTDDKIHVTKRYETCPANDQADYSQKIGEFKEKNRLLREENAELAQLVSAVKERLESKKITREKMVEEIRNGYQDYLANRKKDPIADQKVRENMAKEKFPDDFDPFLWKEVAPYEVPETLPVNCDELRDIERKLRDENADLREQKGLLIGLVRTGFVRLGVPETVAAQYTSAIARLRDVNFRTNTPFGQKAEESVRSNEPDYSKDADIASIEAAASAWVGNHPIDAKTGLREAAPQADMEKYFGPLFPPGEDRNHKMRFQSIEILNDLAQALRNPAMKDMLIFLVGHTSSPGSDAHNLALSKRRARAIRAFLIMSGIPENRMFWDGRGESELIYKRDVIGGGDRANRLDDEFTNLKRYGIKTNGQRREEALRRQAVNRRMEIFVGPVNSTDPAMQALFADPDIQGQMKAAGVIKADAAVTPGGNKGDADDESSTGGGEASPSVGKGTVIDPKEKKK